jgi:hypothetical protein
MKTATLTRDEAGYALICVAMLLILWGVSL